MSLNPKITKDPKGVYWLEWTPDPSAEGYAFTTPGGSSRTFNPELARTKLGRPTPPFTATVAVLDVSQRPPETASYPPTTPPPDPGTFAQNGSGYMRWGGITITSNTEKYGWVFASGGSEWEAAKLIKPKSVFYKSIISASTKTDGRNFGLTGQQALAGGWAMLDQSGKPMYSESFPDCVLLDLGSTSMQTALANAIIASAKDVGIDAVFLDDVVAQGRGYASVTPQKYPTDAAWEDAMAQAMNAVGTKIRQAGFYTIGNVYKRGGGIATATFANRFKAGINGAMFESWPQFPDSPEGVTAVQGHGIDPFALVAAPPDSPECNAGLSAFLNVWNGKAGGFVLAPGSGDGWGQWATKLAYK